MAIDILQYLRTFHDQTLLVMSSDTVKIVICLRKTLTLVNMKGLFPPFDFIQV